MPASDRPDPLAFLGQAGEMAGLIARFDWSMTALGPIATWPQPLRTTLALALRTPLPIVMLWGPDGILIYNDAYAGFAGARHPSLLGAKVLEGWPEAADLNRRVLDVCLSGGVLSLREQMLTLNRHGTMEDCWLDLDYMPILDDADRPYGVYAVVIEITERVRAQQQLHVAQAAGGVGTFEWFPETGTLKVSEAFRHLWGIGPDEAVTDALMASLVESDDQEQLGARRLGTPNPLAYSEFRHRDPKTGAIRWIARQGEPIASPDGTERRFVGVCYDVTARKAAEQALRASEERWRSLFEQMQEGFFIAEAVRDATGTMVDFRFVEMNPAFEARTDIVMAQAIGRPVSEVIPDLPPELIATYASVIETGRPARYEIKVPALKDKWFEARARRVGENRFSVLFLDITGRKRAEAALTESESRFRTLSQSMPNHVWTATADGKLDWCNEQVYVYSGITEGMLDGDHWSDIMHPDDVPHVAAAWEDALRYGSVHQAEFRLRRLDGAYRWHIARAVPVRDEDGTILRWIGTNTDIDDQKTAEVALSDLAATLEQRVAARTFELERTQDALRHSQKMEAIGNLTGGVAHDFNNLLQVISGNLQLLTREVSGNAKAEKRVDNAMAGVSRGSKLAAQLLAFGRRQALEPKVVNVGRLIRGMDDLLRRTLGESIEIETIIAGGLWNTLVDPTNVENSLLNLAINSRDAMNGQGRLTIEAGNAFIDDAYAETHADVAPGQYVQISVTDTGTGMTREIQEQIFEPFFSTKPQGKGTGLGLSMVYGFVKQSGGHVKVYSEPGQGTTFKLYLPRSTQSEDMLVEQETGPVVGGTETVLVVEDDDAVRETVIALLGELGYRVLKAPDAQSALAVIESGVPIDLLFTDVVMPGPLKSAEMARKAKERLPHLSVLFTSGYTENSIVHGGRLDEGVNLLSKPYTREALARKLRQVLVQDGKTPSVATNPPRPRSDEHRQALDAGPTEAQPRKAQLCVLVCEDDAIIRMDTADMVQDLGHLAIEAENGMKALEIGAEREIDILLTDVGLPDISGGELAQRLRAIKPEIAVVFATGRDHVEGFEGAPRTALLKKPYRLHTLQKILDTILD
jgi:PAS domain S-box-containing protein